MSSKENGGPAFARPFSKNGEFSDSQQNRSQEGMSLRDYFAAKALPAILQSDLMVAATRAAKARGLSPEQAVAMAAYEMADAMLQERAR
jgi:hypothetical protein